MQKYVNTGEIITTFPGEKQRIFVGADETLFCAMRHKYVKIAHISPRFFDILKTIAIFCFPLPKWAQAVEKIFILARISNLDIKWKMPCMMYLILRRDGSMTDRQLRHLRRDELIDIIYTLQLRQEQLQKENASLRAELETRQLRVEKAGSLAEAALAVSGVLEAAQRAADIYLTSLSISKESKEEP